MQKKVAIQVGVIGVGCVLLVFLSIPLFQQKESPKKPPVSQSADAVPAPQGKAAMPVSSAETVKLGLIKDDKFYDRLQRVSEFLPLERNPFSFAVVGAQSPRDGLELTGILWNEQKPTAIINQTFVNEGDSIGQFSVSVIEEDRVVLKDASGEFELHLKQ